MVFFLRKRFLVSLFLVGALFFVVAYTAQSVILGWIFLFLWCDIYQEARLTRLVLRNKSTFLVEMEETASICTMATQNSLVILDEVGRGTSTFDGLAIAQAVVEYISVRVQARCLFATHYHELTLLQEQIPTIASYFAACQKTPQGIVFLYKILRGVANGSFGVEVAKLAQLPGAVIARAEQILAVLSTTQTPHTQAIPFASDQEGLAHEYERVLHERNVLRAELERMHAQLRDQEALHATLASIDYNELSPKKAFDVLWQLKKD
jgi:DNA mismatch repair protein MutS